MTTTKLGSLEVITIDKIEQETPNNCRMPVKAITVTLPEMAKKAIPGQFVMMWVYQVDEKPMGIASVDKKTGAVTFAVAKVGPATKAIHSLQKGELIGIRGPYGKGFTLQGKKIAIIGGGTGIAPSRFLTEQALAQGLEVTLFHGARTMEELAFLGYFETLMKKKDNFTYQPSTDDGSFGFKGYSTDCLNDFLKEAGKKYFDLLCTCGPEQMMVKVWKIGRENNLPIQACLADRYFKCAIGLCGQCTVDPTGLRLCIDGPVFDQDQLAKISDFGRFARDKYGKKIPL
jgi:dihydroorotate dehydrogenase electron transfer subunit